MKKHAALFIVIMIFSQTSIASSQDETSIINSDTFTKVSGNEGSFQKKTGAAHLNISQLAKCLKYPVSCIDIESIDLGLNTKKTKKEKACNSLFETMKSDELICNLNKGRSPICERHIDNVKLFIGLKCKIHFTGLLSFFIKNNNKNLESEFNSKGFFIKSKNSQKTAAIKDFFERQEIKNIFRENKNIGALKINRCIKNTTSCDISRRQREIDKALSCIDIKERCKTPVIQCISNSFNNISCRRAAKCNDLLRKTNCR